MYYDFISYVVTADCILSNPNMRSALILNASYYLVSDGVLTYNAKEKYDINLTIVRTSIELLWNCL